MEKYAVKLAVWLLKKRLNLEEKTELMNAVLKSLSALPLRNVIEVMGDGSLSIKGKVLDFEERRILEDSAKALKDNRAFQLIQDQVLYTSLSFGLNQSVTLDMLYTSKAAVWWGSQENQIIKLLANETDQSGVTD
jgi:uncharacterized protein YxjI